MMDEILGFWAHSQCLPWPCFFFFFLQVNETGHIVSDQIIHLWNRAIHWPLSQRCNMEHIQSQGYEGWQRNVFLQKPVNPYSSNLTSVLISSCPDSIRQLLCWRVSQYLPAFSGRKTFILCSKLCSWKIGLYRLCCNEIKAGRKAGVVTAGRTHLLPAPCFDSRAAQSIRMSSQLCVVGRKELISACLPFRDSTAQALFHLQMIKWSTEQLQTKGRNSQLSPGFLNQHD